MTFRETVRVVQPGQRRLKIFIDFWNVVINARKQTNFDINIHWNKIAEYLIAETRAGYDDESSGDLAGCYIFGSFSKSNRTELDFVNRTSDQYGSMSGLFFDFKERVKKETSSKCKKCGARVSLSSESGVDVLLTVEMIKRASMRDHQYLALVSSDRDYIPLLFYLKDQGQRVLHVAPGAAHREMRSVTWKQIEITERYPSLCSIVHEDRLILSSVPKTERLREATLLLETLGLAYKVIDIAKPSDIPNKDLEFLLRNQNLYFRKKGGAPGLSHARQQLYSSLHDFRKAINDGEVDGNLPYVICNGSFEASFNNEHGWVRSGASSSAAIWEALRNLPSQPPAV